MEEKYRVVLCIKPVKTDLITQDNLSEQDALSMNPFDLKALQNLIEKRKSQEDFIVTCLCMGDKRAESVLRRAHAMGADEAILVSDRAFAGSDTVATSYILERAISKLENVKMILCGINTIDGETGQVPQALAWRLGFRQIVKGHEIVEIHEDKLVFKDKDDKNEMLLYVPMPVVMKYTEFTAGIPTISLLQMKRAKNKEIQIMDAQFIEADTSRCGLNGSKTQVLEIKKRMEKKEKTVLDGDSADIAMNLTLLLGKA